MQCGKRRAGSPSGQRRERPLTDLPDPAIVSVSRIVPRPRNPPSTLSRREFSHQPRTSMRRVGTLTMSRRGPTNSGALPAGRSAGSQACPAPNVAVLRASGDTVPTTGCPPSPVDISLKEGVCRLKPVAQQSPDCVQTTNKSTSRVQSVVALRASSYATVADPPASAIHPRSLPQPRTVHTPLFERTRVLPQPVYDRPDSG